MLSIAIYSDNQQDTETLKLIIQDFLIEAHIIARISFFNNPEIFLTAPVSYDIYIMDMDSKDDVIELGRKMRKIDVGCHFIYLSSNTSSAYLAAKARADYFLEKPLDKQEMIQILQEIKYTVQQDNIIIKTAKGDRRIRVNQLNYINIVKRCLCYHLTDGNMFDGQVLRCSFEKAIHPLQNSKMFLFLPPSLLINLSEIKEINGDHVIFENNEILYFPKKSYETVRTSWLHYNQIDN